MLPTNLPAITPHTIAMNKVFERGWPVSENQCLFTLWDRESGWDVYATNPVSGAYESLRRCRATRWPVPARIGAPIRRPRSPGQDYIKANYGTPCNALAHSNAFGWY